jgi:tetratricopeptide (TPR) repeat protein
VNALRKIWIVWKLIYAYVRFWTFPTPSEAFYIMKGNCYFDLGWYERAIISYKKALRDSKDARIHNMLGYCYLRIGDYDNSVEHYEKAVKKIHDPSVALSIAAAEFERGNIEKSLEIIENIRKSDLNYKSSYLDDLEGRVAMVKKEREYLKHRQDNQR